jgi:hypothetical protein
MTAQELCAPIDRHSCVICGVRFTFKVQSVVFDERADSQHGSAILEVYAFRPDYAPNSLAATVRVEAPLVNIGLLPGLLTKVMEEFVLTTAVPQGPVQ